MSSSLYWYIRRTLCININNFHSYLWIIPKTWTSITVVFISKTKKDQSLLSLKNNELQCRKKGMWKVHSCIIQGVFIYILVGKSAFLGKALGGIYLNILIRFNLFWVLKNSVVWLLSRLQIRWCWNKFKYGLLMLAWSLL